VKKYKVMLATALIASTITSFTSQSSYAQDIAFHDITTTFWGYSNIEWALNNHIIEGYPDGTFKPDQHVGEAEFLAMLIRAYQPAEFIPDPNASDWSIPYFTFSSKMGWEVTNPTSVGTSVPLSRGKAAQYLANASGEKLTIDQSIEYLLGIGIIEGKTAKTVEGYQGGDRVTRAEAVALIQRFKSKRDRLLPAGEKKETGRETERDQLIMKQVHEIKEKLKVGLSQEEVQKLFKEEHEIAHDNGDLENGSDSYWKYSFFKEPGYMRKDIPDHVIDEEGLKNKKLGAYLFIGWKNNTLHMYSVSYVNPKDNKIYLLVMSPDGKMTDEPL